MQLIQGNCLEKLKDIPDGSVDMVCCDPPYGTIKNSPHNWGKGEVGVKQCGWDEPIDHEEMLNQCNRVLRMNGCLVLFSQEPYTGKLTTQTHGNLPFSYRLTWLKDNFANALLVNKAPVNYTEDICVFFKKYDTLAQHPLREYAKSFMDWIGMSKKDIQTDLGHQKSDHFFRIDSTQFGICTRPVYDEMVMRYDVTKMTGYKPYAELEDINRRFNRRFNLQDGKKYKSNVLEYKKDYMGLHPTQKPVLLIEDLIKTYTNEGDMVVDFTMGSGTTAVACLNTGRDFIGIELDETYFNVARKRVQAAKDSMALFNPQ